MAIVEATNQAATQGLKPDLTVLLDMPVEEGLARKSKERQDRFEQQDIAFHQRLREGYLKLAAEEPQRWLVVDATLQQAEVAQIIWDKVRQLLAKQGPEH